MDIIATLALIATITLASSGLILIAIAYRNAILALTINLLLTPINEYFTPADGVTRGRHRPDIIAIRNTLELEGEPA